MSGCESICEVYEECYGPIPPALTKAEKKWLERCLEIDEIIFPTPVEVLEDVQEEVLEEVAMNDKQKENMKKEAEKAKKEFEKLMKTDAEKHYAKCKERFYDEKTKF